MKLLPSWPVYPQVWFTQVEAQYATHDVNSQKTLFDYIIAIASLSPKFATEVCDLILKPRRNCIRTVEKTTHKTYSCLRTKKTAETVQFWGFRQPQAHAVVRNKTAVVRGYTWHNWQIMYLQTVSTMSPGQHLNSSSLNRWFCFTRQIGITSDKVVEVATPQPVSTVRSLTLSDEVKKLKGQLTNLTQLVKSLPF